MKRFWIFLLALTLLCGCAGPGEPTAAPTTTEPVPPATEAPALAGPEALAEGTVLFYAQPDFEARQGTLVPLETVRSAPAEALLPRAHLYDDSFSGEIGLWLRLLDYALANGYQGFSVPAGTLPAFDDAHQNRMLTFLYRIDGGKILSLEEEGRTTVWYDCAKPDTMEKFSLGLAAAREIAAQVPRGDDYETARWIMDYLAAHVVYGDRDTYYFRRGHQLYDALVEQDCICSGYAEAMYYLCNLCGVDCLGVVGTASNPDIPGGLDGHAWNLAKLEGSWYCFDPTMNAVSQLPAGQTIAFGLSTDALYLLGGHKLRGEYTDKALIPACETCFDPVAVWNGSPEGALRSWLWYDAQAKLGPAILLFASGLAAADMEAVPTEDGALEVSGLSLGDLEAWTLRFMAPDCAAEYLSGTFRSGPEGALRFVPAEAFREPLTAADVADYTAAQAEDGAWYITSVTLAQGANP